jgi:hypothetical protein
MLSVGQSEAGADWNNISEDIENTPLRFGLRPGVEVLLLPHKTFASNSI